VEAGLRLVLGSGEIGRVVDLEMALAGFVLYLL